MNATGPQLSMTDWILHAEAIIDYRFNDESLLWEALQSMGSGASQIRNREMSEGNKRLAVVGDAILRLVVVEEWYRTAGLRGVLTPVLTTHSHSHFPPPFVQHKTAG